MARMSIFYYLRVIHMYDELPGVRSALSGWSMSVVHWTALKAHRSLYAQCQSLLALSMALNMISHRSLCSGFDVVDVSHDASTTVHVAIFKHLLCLRIFSGQL
jgi:hypothetical protein